MLGSGERIRTFDLVVTLIHCFRSGVDYIIILIGWRKCAGFRMQGAVWEIIA